MKIRALWHFAEGFLILWQKEGYTKRDIEYIIKVTKVVLK